MRRKVVVDHAVAAIADRQGGVIARGQLIAIGCGVAAGSGGNGSRSGAATSSERSFERS
jgi:hypothetical protein